MSCGQTSISTHSNRSLEREAEQNARAVLDRGPSEFGAATDVERDVGVGTPSAKLRTFQPAPIVNRDGQNSDCRIGRSAREQLREVECERVRVVHHRAERGVHLVLDERLQAGDERNVEADGLEHEIERRRLHEREVDRLDCNESSPRQD